MHCKNHAKPQLSASEQDLSGFSTVAHAAVLSHLFFLQILHQDLKTPPLAAPAPALPQRQFSVNVGARLPAIQQTRYKKK